MKEFAVTYSLEEDELERLRRITERYKEIGLDLPIEKMFEGIMQAGSRYDIDGKLKCHERKLGLRED